MNKFDNLKQRISHPNDDARCEVFFDGKWVSHARIIMESHLGRVLASDEVVHHINGDTLDDRIENLQLMSNSEHATYHNIRDRKHRYLPSSKGENNPRWIGDSASNKTRQMRLWRKRAAATHTNLTCMVDNDLFDKLNEIVEIALTEDKSVTKASTIRAILELTLNSVLREPNNESRKERLLSLGILRRVAE